MIELTVIGNLGADAVMNENKTTGKKILNFNICRSEVVKRRMEAAGDEKKQWVDCAYFSDDEDLLKLLTKGTLVFVKGWPEARVHIKKDGTPSPVQYLKVSKVEVLSIKRAANQ